MRLVHCDFLASLSFAFGKAATIKPTSAILKYYQADDVTSQVYVKFWV